ncbi:MAG: hypothetical protein BMS9Abin37_2873 [Acidobacteriota bacterium]|nr:MAG: hypothetical protein BMS9Abin37_2873 [Acidobacteriota bacterium]
MERSGYDRNKEHQAKCIVRDVESHLREHLGVERLDSDFVADLYLRILEELRARPRAEDAEEELMSSLALTVYFLVASQPEVCTPPDLIPRVRKAIARTLANMRPANSVAPSRRADTSGK